MLGDPQLRLMQPVRERSLNKRGTTQDLCDERLLKKKILLFFFLFFSLLLLRTESVRSNGVVMDNYNVHTYLCVLQHAGR